MSALAVRKPPARTPARRISQSLSRKWVRSTKIPVVSGDYTIITLPECYLLLHRTMPLGMYSLQSTAKMAAERHGAGYSHEFNLGGWR